MITGTYRVRRRERALRNIYSSDERKERETPRTTSIIFFCTSAFRLRRLESSWCGFVGEKRTKYLNLNKEATSGPEIQMLLLDFHGDIYSKA